MYVKNYVDFSILARIAWIFVYDLWCSRKTLPHIFFGLFPLIFVEITYANNVSAFYSVNRYYRLMKTCSTWLNVVISIFVTIVWQMINKTLYKIIVPAMMSSRRPPCSLHIFEEVLTVKICRVKPFISNHQEMQSYWLLTGVVSLQEWNPKGSLPQKGPNTSKFC